MISQRRMKNIMLTVAYDGTAYHGYQIQPDLVTVEGTLKRALEETVKAKVRVTSAGRTDAGVHAMGQVANFYSDTTIDLGNLPRVINFHLPDDISVVGAKEVPLEFHSRFDAKGKWYRYVIYNGRYRNPIHHNRAAFMRFPLDVEAMDRALRPLEGYHDFAAFMGRYAVVKDTLRDVYSVKIRRRGDMVIADFHGKSFLKNMIRIVMGTAMEIGRHLRDEGDIGRAVATGNKEFVGHTADPSGLYLMKVDY